MDDNHNTQLKHPFQSVMEGIFAPMNTIHKNQVTPAVSKLQDGGTLVTAVIVAVGTPERFFRENNDFEVGITMEVLPQESISDLKINFDFMNDTEEIKLHATVEGANVKRQEQFVDAIKKTKNILLFIANKDYQLMKAMEIPFDAKAFRDPLSQL